jgi:hypothetical protein
VTAPRTREEREALHRAFSDARLARLAGEAKQPAAVRRAMALLDEELSRGPRSAVEMRHWAARVGISTKTLRKAREALGVLCTNGGKTGSTWRLP